MQNIGALKIYPEFNNTSEILNYLRVLLSNDTEVFTSPDIFDAYITGKQLASPIDEIKSLNYILTFCTNAYNKTRPEIV